MASEMPHLQQESVFGPEAVQAMSAAYEQVCRSLHLENDARAREAIAIRIIELARRGEQDPERLSQRVLEEANGSEQI
jgi:hypothetical protein